MDSNAPMVIPAMRIVYRLAGLDGEATEDRIEQLLDEEDDEKNPE